LATGKYVPETLIPALAELEVAYKQAMDDPAFHVSGALSRPQAAAAGSRRAAWTPHRSPAAARVPRAGAGLTARRRPPAQAELNAILKDYVGRETPLYYAERLSERYRRRVLGKTCSIVAQAPGFLARPQSRLPVEQQAARRWAHLRQQPPQQDGPLRLHCSARQSLFQGARAALPPTASCRRRRCRREDGSMPEIYLKREDLNHTGAHKINNALGQALLCKRMGKTRIIAETGAGQHGVATVRVCVYVCGMNSVCARACVRTQLFVRGRGVLICGVSVSVSVSVCVLCA
jgi:hypothetical protein